MPSARSVPAALVRSDKRLDRGVRLVGLTAPRRGLHELGQRPHRDQQLVARAGALGRAKGGVVAAEAVVENGPRVLGEGDHNPVAAPRDRSWHNRVEEDLRLHFDPAKAGQRESSEDQRLGARRGGDVIGLVEESAGTIEIALEAAHVREMVQREREDGEGAALTCHVDASSGKVMPGVVGE